MNEFTLFELANLLIYKRFQSIHLYYYTDISLHVRVSLFFSYTLNRNFEISHS